MISQHFVQIVGSGGNKLLSYSRINGSKLISLKESELEHGPNNIYITI